MKLLRAFSANHALQIAMGIIQENGQLRPSRDGDVLQYPGAVATIYDNPRNRVMFWPERDANPFFHIYESLWMLAGRNDVKPLKQFVSTFDRFSDDGATLHGAYGYRWRKQFGFDQLATIAEILTRNKDDRRCVLQIWDAELDLGKQGKDVPCNDTVTFQIDLDGQLEMVVFCRSNDIIMGAYGANIVQFSILQEYLAAWIGVEMGTYTQISVNWHAYLRNIEKVKSLQGLDPYRVGSVRPLEMMPVYDRVRLDNEIVGLLDYYDSGLIITDNPFDNEWIRMAYDVLRAHYLWKNNHDKKYAVWTLENSEFRKIDFIEAAIQWMRRRLDGNQDKA